MSELSVEKSREFL